MKNNPNKNMTMIIDNDNEKKRAELFLNSKIQVHISKTDGRFLNGFLVSIGSDFFIIRDRFNNGEQFIFFSELKKPIEPFREVVA